MKKEFTKQENEILSEIYRRLNYFHKGNLSANLLYLALPSEAAKISKYGLIKPYSKEVPRALNWYNLTEKGKSFFKNYKTAGKLSDKTNAAIFDRTYIKSFDKAILEAI